MKEDYKFKIVILGDPGDGKINLVKRFIQNTFSSNSLATVGLGFFSNTYYIMGTLLVNDITNQVTFNNIERWYNEIRDFSSKDI